MQHTPLSLQAICKRQQLDNCDYWIPSGAKKEVGPDTFFMHLPSVIEFFGEGSPIPTQGLMPGPEHTAVGFCFV